MTHFSKLYCIEFKLFTDVCSVVGIRQFDSNLKDIAVEVVAGNTAVIPCEPPASRPVALTVFEINGTTIDESHGENYPLANS